MLPARATTAATLAWWRASLGKVFPRHRGFATRRDAREILGLLIDGLFGIGLARDITGGHAALVEYANRQRCPVLALDIPSGLHADTGRVLGCAVRATHTMTFIALKPGLLTLTDRIIAARSWWPT